MMIKKEDSELKKMDLIMIATILVTALALWGGMFLMRKGDYGCVRITVNGLGIRNLFPFAKGPGDRHWRYKCLRNQKWKNQNDRGRLSRPSLHQPESCRELRRDHCVPSQSDDCNHNRRGINPRLFYYFFLLCPKLCPKTS